MNVSLTWDLFFIAFFSIIVTYSCILGKRHTLKIIISTYIAILAADGLGNLMSTYLFADSRILSLLTQASTAQILVLAKILIFILTIVLLVTRGAFSVNLDAGSSFMNFIMTIAYAAMSAGLILSTLLIYSSGISLVSGGANFESDIIYDIYRSSQVPRLLINNYSTWFSLPAVIFVISSFLSKEPPLDIT